MVGREDQIKQLNDLYETDRNSLTILYGRRRTGKTALVKEFVKDKSFFYFNALPEVDFELLNSFYSCINSQYPSIEQYDDYESAFDKLVVEEGIEVIVIENFNNIVKVDPNFMTDIVHFIKVSKRKIMFILTCASVQWVENTMVKAIGTTAFSINSFIKLKKVDYSSVVAMYPEMDPRSSLYAYAVTGGIPGYLSKWDDSIGVKENVCNLILDREGYFFKEAEQFVAEEFRETSVYNTILACLAKGLNKLNEIHEYTGFGRDKISVYLNNLIEREIVEKIFSFDAGNNRTTRKGLYNIQDGFINFWYKFIYPNYGMLEVISPSEFYDRYIMIGIKQFVTEAFINVGCEFFEIMSNANRLAVQGEYKGRWYGKLGDIHIVYSGEEGDVVGQVHTGEHPFDIGDYNQFSDNFSVAGIKPKQVIIFSTIGFSEEFIQNHDDMVMLVRIEDL